MFHIPMSPMHGRHMNSIGRQESSQFNNNYSTKQIKGKNKSIDGYDEDEENSSFHSKSDTSNLIEDDDSSEEERKSFISENSDN